MPHKRSTAQRSSVVGGESDRFCFHHLHDTDELSESFAGLFAARVCHDHFDDVVIVEPEAWANDPEAKCQDAWNQAKPRSRVMQYKSLQGRLRVSLNCSKGLTS